MEGRSRVCKGVRYASKEGGHNDWSVCTTWLHHENKYYLMDVLRGRFDYPTLKARAISHAGDEAAAGGLDFGCGDLEVVKDPAIRRYVGMDQSSEALGGA